MFFKILLILSLFFITSYADKIVQVGVLAKRGNDVTVTRWSSTMEYLSKNIDGYTFKLVPLSFEELKESVAKGEVEFFLTNPMYYVELEHLYGASRIATLKNSSSYGYGLTNFGGVIFTLKDSDIDSVEDIKGKRFGAVNLSSFGGWVMAQKEFKNHGITMDDFGELSFFGSHNAVVRGVIDKTINAGTVRSDTLERMEIEGLIDLADFKIIAAKKYDNFPYLVSTALYPEWPFAKSSKTSEALANQVLSVLLSIPKDSKILVDSNVSGWTIPLDYTKVNKVLEELHLGAYKEYGKLTFDRFYERYKYPFYGVIVVFFIIIAIVMYISRLNSKLQNSNKHIEELNHSLEKKVQARTKEINKMYLEEKFLKNILKTISDINELLVSSFSIKNIVENSVKRLIQQEEYSYVWIGIINKNNLEVVCEHKNGSDIIDEFTYSLAKDYDDDIVFNLSKDSIDSDEIIIKQLQRTLNKKSWAITIPIKITLEDATKEVLGNLCVFSKLEDGFLDEEIKMLEELAKDIAIALNSVLQQTKLKALELEKISNYEETILAFVNIIEQRDSYTAGHTIRVAEYCKLIAEAMDMDADDVVKIQKAAILHDIGKVVTPDSILLKPGKLMPLEYNLIKEHSSAGYAMLSKIKMYSDLAEIIKYHHSNYDGQGYPHVDKDKLDTIPILSHIMMIADAFDAMTSNRIYKSRKTIPEALEELRVNSGTQFHPEIVKVAMKVLADVTIQDTSQMPKNELEKRRFAYFFMDSLTDLYNEDYLKIEIAKNETKEKFFVMLELKRFSKYNEKNGWKNGNIFLKEFATLLKKRYPNTLIFRYRGDDFVLLFDKKIDILESEFIELPLLKDKNIDLSVKTLGFNGLVPDLFS